VPVNSAASRKRVVRPPAAGVFATSSGCRWQYWDTARARDDATTSPSKPSSSRPTRMRSCCSASAWRCGTPPCGHDARLQPRYLHSTGQLHKGGPDRGIFIQIVDDLGDIDLRIPHLRLHVPSAARRAGPRRAHVAAPPRPPRCPATAVPPGGARLVPAPPTFTHENVVATFPDFSQIYDAVIELERHLCTGAHEGGPASRLRVARRPFAWGTVRPSPGGKSAGMNMAWCLGGLAESVARRPPPAVPDTAAELVGPRLVSDGTMSPRPARIIASGRSTAGTR
jgi:hypothetical protein